MKVLEKGQDLHSFFFSIVKYHIVYPTASCFTLTGSLIYKLPVEEKSLHASCAAISTSV